MPYGFVGKILERFGQRISEGTVVNMLVELKRLAEMQVAETGSGYSPG